MENFCKINHMCKSFAQVKMKLQGITGSKENALELLGEVEEWAECRPWNHLHTDTSPAMDGAGSRGPTPAT